MQQASAPWYAHRWPWLLILGPTVVVVASLYTAWLSFHQADALVVDDYYKQGRAINQDLRRDQAAAAIGLHADIGYDAAQGRLNGKVAARGQAHRGRVMIKLVHSTLPEKDLQLMAQVGEDGRFSVSLPLLDMARWEVQVEGAAEDWGSNWRLTGIWNWPKQKQVVLDADG